MPQKMHAEMSESVRVFLFESMLTEEFSQPKNRNYQC